MNIYQRFDAAFRTAGDAPALICPDREDWSYRQLRDAVGRMAAALTNLGVSPDERVLVQVEKTPQAVALYLACLQIGAVYTPINTAYTAPEVAYFLNDAEPALFVANAPFATAVRTETLDANGGGSLAALAAQESTLDEAAPRAAADTAAIIYTSGTTGRSKGAMLSHANLASNAATLCACWGWRNDDVLLHALPIFHVHGLFVALHCAFLSGTPTIFLPRFNAAAVLRELPRSTVLMGVPTFYTRLLNDSAFNAEACRNMRLFISGSAPLAEQTFAAFERRTGMRILERYGMSETLMNTSNPLDPLDPLDGARLAGSVGFALPGVAVRIADAAGRPLPAGAVGGIEVRGPNVFKGYWRMPEKTREEFRADGFFATGDMGSMDEEGRIRIVGRAKDLVISGGCNVYPKEVETLLDTLPGVQESAVIGVPHADFGEAVVAIMVADQTVDKARVDAFLKDKLARHKQPKRVIRVAELPRNALGKVRKNILRDTYSDVFASDSA